jgi:hypothetical protein
VLVLREYPGAGTVARVLVVTILVVAATVWWVRRRDEWRKKLRDFLEAGRAAGDAA